MDEVWRGFALHSAGESGSGICKDHTHYYEQERAMSVVKIAQWKDGWWGLILPSHLPSPRQPSADIR